MAKMKGVGCGNNPNSIKAGTKNMIPVNTRPKDEQKAIRAKGAKASHAVQQRKRTIAEALKAILYERSEMNPDKQVLDDWLEALMGKMLLNPDSKDLKIIVEVLGEMRQQIEVNADIKAKAELFKLPDGE